MKNFQLRIPQITLAAGLSLAAPGWAATWQGSDNAANNFNTAANWNPSGVPGNTTEVIIGAGATVNSTTTFNRAANTTLNGSLTVSNNTHFNLNNGTNTNTVFTVGSTGSLTYAPTTTSASGSQYLVGTGSGATTFNQDGGTVNITVIRGIQLSDGAALVAGRTGTFNINGGTFNATISASAAADAIGEIYGGFLAGRAGATTPDSFNVAGGNATISAPNSPTRKFTITNGASVNISSGSLSFNGFAQNRIGYDDTNIADTTGSVSKVTVSGGMLTLAMGGTTPFLSVGASTNYNGAFEVTGGTLSISGAQLTLGDVSSGTFTQSGGTVDLNGQTLRLANGGSATGLYTMSSGTLLANTIQTGSGNATFGFTGGDIWLIGDQTALPDSSWFVTPDPALVARDFNSGTNRTHIYMVPEPAATGLAGLAMLGLMLRRRK